MCHVSPLYYFLVTHMSVLYFILIDLNSSSLNIYAVMSDDKDEVFFDKLNQKNYLVLIFFQLENFNDLQFQ